MKTKTRITSSQPEVNDTPIYGGGKKVKPLDSSNQPATLPNTRVYSSKLTRQVRVKMKGGSDEDAFLIRKTDFDASKHERL